MKKLFSMILVLCMMLSLLAACGGNGDETTGSTGEEVPQTTDQTTEPEGTTEPDEGPRWELSLNHEDITLVNQGETMNLYDGTAPMAEITWGSEDESVATFRDGVVTAVGNGETVVYAEYEGVKVSCTVYCNLKETTEEPTTPSQPTDGGTTTGGSRDPVLAAPTAQAVDSSFFDDAVFIGDSISLKLSHYASSSGLLGKAKFLVVGSYGVSNAINDHPDTKLTYQGVSYTNFEEALAATGAKKLFIMLGMNDIGLYGIDKTISNWSVMLDMIHDTCPDMTVYIQSMTPVWTGGEKGSLNNANVDKYNARLQEFAQNNGYKFIDVAPYMKDSTGGLATKFCSDSYVHLTDEGAKTWIQVLKAYTGY